jgi:hypothetical protein
MSDAPRTQNAFAIANLHQNKRMKAIHDEMCQLERELAEARKQRDTLAEALKLFPEGLHLADERGPCLCSHCEAVRTREKALAAVKGGDA